MQETPKLVLNGQHLAGVQQLQLVDPRENRYQITSLAAGSWYLETWDGQHRHALLFGGRVEATGSQLHQSDKIMVLDLVDGTQHAFSVPASESIPLFGGSDGQYLIYVDLMHRVQRYSLTGQPQQPSRPIPSSAVVADSPDGRQAIVDGRSGLDVYDYASGQRVGNLPPPKGYAGCYDPQWGGDGKLVASCLQAGNRTKVGTVRLLGRRRDSLPGEGSAVCRRGRPPGDRLPARGGSHRYPNDDKNPTPDSFPALTHLTTTRRDAAGRTISIPVPAQLRNSQS